MSDQGKIEKIHKLDTKHKTASIIKLMEGKHSDTEVICAALEALGAGCRRQKKVGAS